MLSAARRKPKPSRLSQMAKARFTAKYWQDRAEEARAIALEVRDASVKETMERVARMYDRLAKNEAKREAEHSK